MDPGYNQYEKVLKDAAAIERAFQSAYTNIKMTLGEVGLIGRTTIGAVKTEVVALNSLLGSGLKTSLTTVTSAFGGLRGAVQAGIPVVTKFFTGWGFTALQVGFTAVSTVVEGLFNTVKAVGSAIGSLVSGSLSLLRKGVSGIASALEFLGPAAELALGGLASLFQDVYENAKKAEEKQYDLNGSWEKAPLNTFSRALGVLGQNWDTLATTLGNFVIKNETVIKGMELLAGGFKNTNNELINSGKGFSFVSEVVIGFVKVLAYLVDGVNIVQYTFYTLRAVFDSVIYGVALMAEKIYGFFLDIATFAAKIVKKVPGSSYLFPGLDDEIKELQAGKDLASSLVYNFGKALDETGAKAANNWDKLSRFSEGLRGVAKQLEATAGKANITGRSFQNLPLDPPKTDPPKVDPPKVTPPKVRPPKVKPPIEARPLPPGLTELAPGLSSNPPPPPLLEARPIDFGIVGLAPLVESKNVTQQINEHLLRGKAATEAWGKALENVAGIFSGLGSLIGGDTGKKLGEIGGIWKSGSEAGNKLATAFNIKDGKFDFSNFTGEKGVGATVGAYAGAATAAIGAVGQIADATNVKGRGNRALRGAAAGAAIGANPALAASTMGISVAAGAVIGALVGALRNPAFEDVFNRVAKNFGVKISDETAKAIATLAKTSFKGDRQAAEIFSLDKIISEAGGVTDKNVKLLTDRLRDAFSMKETGKFTGEQLTETLNKNFGAFAEHVKKSKDLASKSFQEIIGLNERFGSESAAIQEFIKGQTESLGGSIAALAAPLVEQYGGLAEKIAGAQAAVSQLSSQGKTGTEEYAAAVKSLTALQEQQRAGAAGSAEEFERLGLIALAAFNASIQGGSDYLTAVQAMQPALGQLIQLQTDLGITTQNAALAELTSFSARVEANQGLVTATAALGETMRALASIGGLNTETLAAMEAQGMQTFERLIGAGFTEGQALQQMKDYLLNVVQAHEQLGTPIDENTAKLIAMAQQQGILKADGQSMTDILKSGFENLTSAVTAVARVLGADIPEAAGLARQAIDDIPNNVDVNVNYHTRGYPGDVGSADGGGVEGYAKGTGGFRNFGSGTLAMLHGWEAVIPMNQLAGAGGGGQGVQVNVWLNDDIIGRAAARGLPAMLDVYGATR
jgi:hypothetical protein